MTQRIRYINTCTIVAALLALVFASPAEAQDIHLQKAVVSNSGGSASNGTHTLNYTIGQAVTGRGTNGQTTGTFGFWNESAAVSGVAASEQIGTVASVHIVPNPVVTNTGEVRLQLVGTGQVEVSLYSAEGKKVTQLFNGKRETGELVLTFSTEPLSNGVYYITVRVPGGILQKTLSVLK